MALKILHTGIALPKKRVSNFDLEKFMETSDEWIRTRTGIVERRISNDIDTSELAVLSAQQAIQGLSPEQIDSIELIIVATLSADQMMPSISSIVHHKLGLKEKDFMVVDINMACTGFVGAMRLAHGMLTIGKSALLIGADVLSKIVDKEDRSTAVLFGDGAGCCVVMRTDEEIFFDAGVVEDLHVITMQGRTIDDKGINDDPYLHMLGKDVYRFAVSKVPESIEALANKAGIALTDVDHFVLHQANARIIQQIAKRLDQEDEKFVLTLDQYGNTSASSIPLALHFLQEKQAIHEGELVLFSSFGAGLQYMSALMRW